MYITEVALATLVSVLSVDVLLLNCHMVSVEKVICDG